MNPQTVWIETPEDAIRDPIPRAHDFGANPDYWEDTAPATFRWEITVHPDMEARPLPVELPGYTLHDREAVVTFVRMSTPLEQVLRDVQGPIRRMFVNARLHLRVERLPSENWFPKLVLRVETDLPRREALEHLSTFRMEWWTQQQRAVGERLRIALE